MEMEPQSDSLSQSGKFSLSLVSHEKSHRASEVIRDFLHDDKVSLSYKKFICGDCFPYFNTKVESLYSDLKSSILEYKKSVKMGLELGNKEDQFLIYCQHSSKFNSKTERPPLLPYRSSFIDEFDDLNQRLIHLDYEVDTVTAKLESTARVLHASLSELENLPISEEGNFDNHPLQAPAIYCNQCNATGLKNMSLSNQQHTEGSTTNTGQLFARLGYSGSYLRLSFSAVGSINLGWSEVNGSWVNMACLMLSLRSDSLLPAELTFCLDQKEPHYSEHCSRESIIAPRVATLHVLPLSGRVQLSLSIPSDQSSVQYLCLQGGVLNDRHLFEAARSTAANSISVSGSLYLRAALLFAAGVVQTSFDLDHHDSDSSGAPSLELTDLCSSCEHFHRHCQSATSGSSDIHSVTDGHSCRSCGCSSSMERGSCTRRIAWELVHALNPDSAEIAADCKWKKRGAQGDLTDSLWFEACDCTVTLSDMDVLLLDLSCILKSLISRSVR